MSTKKQEEMKESILANANAKANEFSTYQEQLHKTVLIEAARYVFIYKDATIVQKVLNCFSEQKGFRIEAVEFWFKDIVGVPTEYNEKAGWHNSHLAKDEYPSSKGVPFTYDKKHLEYCKAEAFRFWKIAPVYIKPYKVGELEKMTSSAEIQLARGIAVGVLTPDEVQAYLADMFKRVEEAMNSKAVRKWTGEYFAQNKVETKDEVEEELAELLHADLLED